MSFGTLGFINLNQIPGIKESKILVGYPYGN
jgi:hypothetical protein